MRIYKLAMDVMGFEDIPLDVDLPLYLYHGTSNRDLDSINDSGLGNTMKSNWSHLLKTDYTVHLATTALEAKVWSESPNPLVLEVNVDLLDRDKLFYDPENRDGFVYRGVIKGFKVIL